MLAAMRCGVLALIALFLVLVVFSFLFAATAPQL